MENSNDVRRDAGMVETVRTRGGGMVLHGSGVIHFTNNNDGVVITDLTDGRQLRLPGLNAISSRFGGCDGSGHLVAAMFDVDNDNDYNVVIDIDTMKVVDKRRL